MYSPVVQFIQSWTRLPLQLVLQWKMSVVVSLGTSIFGEFPCKRS